jgi:hypothetical protein
MSIESREQVSLTSERISGDTWSQVANDAYERNGSSGLVQVTAAACNPRLDAPITPAERILPPLTIVIPLGPTWGTMAPGCRQVPRRPGAA